MKTHTEKCTGILGNTRQFSVEYKMLEMHLRETPLASKKERKKSPLFLCSTAFERKVNLPQFTFLFFISDKLQIKFFRQKRWLNNCCALRGSQLTHTHTHRHAKKNRKLSGLQYLIVLAVLLGLRSQYTLHRPSLLLSPSFSLLP